MANNDQRPVQVLVDRDKDIVEGEDINILCPTLHGLVLGRRDPRARRCARLLGGQTAIKERAEDKNARGGVGAGRMLDDCVLDVKINEIIIQILVSCESYKIARRHCDCIAQTIFRKGEEWCWVIHAERDTGRGTAPKACRNGSSRR